MTQLIRLVLLTSELFYSSIGYQFLARGREKRKKNLTPKKMLETAQGGK